jgi:hypothetical protein
MQRVMKKALLLLLGLAIGILSNACEICGCGVGNIYLGVLPQFNHRFIGLRYHINSFHTRLKDDPTQFSNDLYQTLEMWGGLNLGKKWQVLAIVPVNFNHQVSDEGTTSLNGLGDVVLIANYKLFDLSSTKKRIYQQLWLGGGIKLPTGKFNIDANDPDVASLANTQIGSGTTDLMLNTMYNIRIKNWGVNTTATYKLNTENKEGYKFGNKTTLNSLLYYSARAGSAGVSPNAGFIFEHSDPSTLQAAKINLTGGSLLLGTIGTEFSFNNLSVGFNVQLPIAQNFAGNQTKEKIKGMMHVSFAF